MAASASYEESKDDSQIQFVAPEDFEEIVYANFMSDHDPSFIFMVTYNPTR